MRVLASILLACSLRAAYKQCMRRKHGTFLISLATTALLLCGVTQTAFATPVLIASAIWNNGGTQHEYRLYSDDAIKWNDARRWINTNLSDYHLATITDAAEQTFLNAAFIFPTESEYWLGGYQNPINTKQANSNWTWITGEAWSYTNWISGEPNDYYGPGSEQFLAQRPQQWNDESNPINIWGFLAERTSQIPEPVTLLLVGTGIGCMAACKFKQETAIGHKS